MKKLTAIITAIIATLFIFTGCGGSGGSAPGISLQDLGEVAQLQSDGEVTTTTDSDLFTVDEGNNTITMEAAAGLTNPEMTVTTPDGVTIEGTTTYDEETGTITFTPTDGTDLDDGTAYQVTVVNGTEDGSSDNVAANSEVTIENGTIVVSNAGEFSDGTITVDGVPGTTTYNATTGELIFTPNDPDAIEAGGDYTVTVTDADGESLINEGVIAGSDVDSSDVTVNDDGSIVIDGTSVASDTITVTVNGTSQTINRDPETGDFIIDAGEMLQDGENSIVVTEADSVLYTGNFNAEVGGNPVADSVITIENGVITVTNASEIADGQIAVDGVPGTTTYNAATDELVFTPDDPNAIQAGDSYTVTVVDANGETQLSDSYVAEATVQSSDVEVLDNGTIVINGNAVASDVIIVTINGESVQVFRDPLTGNFTYQPDPALVDGEEYTIQITDGSTSQSLYQDTFVASVDNTSNDTGGNGDGDGITTVSEITVENGELVISGEYLNIDDVTVTLVDSDGNTVEGTLVQDPVTGEITFEPSEPLEVSETYTLTVEENGEVLHEGLVVISVDNTSQLNSLFSQVDDKSDDIAANGRTTYTFSELAQGSRVIVGWDFENVGSFNFKISNLPAGWTVKLTAYGIYDIEGYRDQVFYQKWKSSGEPVKDFTLPQNYTIMVDATDSLLDSGPWGDVSFCETFMELKVYDQNGAEMTEFSDAEIELW